MRIDKKIIFLVVVAIVLSFLPISIASFSAGSISIYQRITPPEPGAMYACVITEKITGFPFGVLSFYSPGCPPDLSVRVNFFGFILNVIALVFLGGAIARIIRSRRS